MSKQFTTIHLRSRGIILRFNFGKSIYCVHVCTRASAYAFAYRFGCLKIKNLNHQIFIPGGSNLSSPSKALGTRDCTIAHNNRPTIK